MMANECADFACFFVSECEVCLSTHVRAVDVGFPETKIIFIETTKGANEHNG